jgi:hypothetical protein
LEAINKDFKWCIQLYTLFDQKGQFFKN